MEAEKLEYNEHFHWGCFEWMHAHSYLDEEKLTSQGLAKAVIYEACARAKALGAKRAIVVSEQEFYFELDSHFPQKCMIGREIIKQNGWNITNYAS